MRRDCERENHEDWKKGLASACSGPALATEGNGMGKGKGSGKAKGSGKGKGRGSGKEGRGGGRGGTSQGGGKGRAASSAGQASGDKKYCYFHNHGGCSKGKECHFSHDTPQQAILDKMEKLSGRSRSRSEGPKAKAKAKVRAKSRGRAMATPDGQEQGHPRPASLSRSSEGCRSFGAHSILRARAAGAMTARFRT